MMINATGRATAMQFIQSYSF